MNGGIYLSNSLQSVVKLSQWDALALESLKAHGWSNAALIERVRTGDLPQDNSKFKFDYINLTELMHSDADILEQALIHGYQIKFNTIRGIQSWLLLALRVEAGVHAEPGSVAITARLTEAEAHRVASTLSYGWRLTVQAQANSHDDDARRIYVIVPHRTDPL